MQEQLTSFKHRLALVSQSITGANPQGILERGYAIVYDRQTGTVLCSAKEAAAGSKLRIRVADGDIYAESE